MPTIRVDPSRLPESAQTMAGWQEIADAMRPEAFRLCSSAPSYDGQFGPQVQAIGDEAAARLKAIAHSLEARHDFLTAKAEAFEAADQETVAEFTHIGQLLAILLRAQVPSTVSWAPLAGPGDDTIDEICRLLSYSLFGWTVTAEEESRILELLRSSDLSQVVRELNSRGMLSALLSRVNEGSNRGDLLRLLGASLDDSARLLVEPYIRALGPEAELQYNLARLGVDFAPADFDRSAYEHLIGDDPGDPFTGVGATGANATTLSVPPADQILLALDDPATWSKYQNPLLGLDTYLDGLTAEQRRAQVELLLNQPISTVMPEAYGGELPSRSQVIEAAAVAYNVSPDIVAAFILAEQRDQSAFEDAAEYVGGVSLLQGNTSIGLGQVVISTARNNDLFSDLLSPETSQSLSQNETAELLASDEVNIFAVAKDIRTVADQAAAVDITTIPDTQALFPGLDLEAYSYNSTSWPDDNIRALASEYTSAPWDDTLFPGWSYFVHEAYQDVINSGVFP